MTGDDDFGRHAVVDGKRLRLKPNLVTWGLLLDGSSLFQEMPEY